jgi:hypothetical protein
MEVYIKLTRRPLYLPVGTPLATKQESGWGTETVWAFWRREKYFLPVGNRTADRPIRNLITVLNTLSHLP